MDINEHPHFALLQSENYVSPRERAWLQWVKKVEGLLGHSLDGDQDTDGYSLDYAHDAFSDGASAEEYADEVKAEKAEIAKRPQFYTVAVYLIDKAYGGPEEGGWWYECGERIDEKLDTPDNGNIAVPRIFTDEDEASEYTQDLQGRLDVHFNAHRRSDIGSVLSEGRYVARMCDGYPEPGFPAVRPHYE